MSSYTPIITSGTWTPLDDSGAGLTFASVTATWTKIGNMVFAQANLTYPSTADTSSAKIKGLPFATANSAAARQGTLNYANPVGSVAYIVPTANSTDGISIFSATGSSVTNVNITGVQVWFQCIYPVS